MKPLARSSALVTAGAVVLACAGTPRQAGPPVTVEQADEAAGYTEEQQRWNEEQQRLEEQQRWKEEQHRRDRSIRSPTDDMGDFDESGNFRN